MSTELLDILGELWIAQEETPFDYMSFHCGCRKGKYRLPPTRWHIEVLARFSGPPEAVRSKSGKRYEGIVRDPSRTTTLGGILILASDDLEEVKEAMLPYFNECEHGEE